MIITRRALSEMVATEVRRRLRELVEADDEGGGDGKAKKPRKPQTADADDSPSPKGLVPAGPRATAGSPDMAPDEDPSGPSVDGDQPDPEAEADREEDEEDAIDVDGDSGDDEPSGAVNDEVSGKTVQAVTVEPESEVSPGSKEIVLAFNESTDTLRIIVTPTGQVKFFWRGQLHDLP